MKMLVLIFALPLKSSSLLSTRPAASRSKRKAVKNLNQRWPNNVIPYKIAPNTFSDRDKVEINAAIAEWENHTCLSFRTATDLDVNHLKFDTASFCYSYIGMIGGSQAIGLGYGCRWKSVIVHEIGHAVGFHHEHNRPDRDDYVMIKKENIPERNMGDFKKYPWSYMDTLLVPYDYLSVMHYGGTYYSINGELTIQTKYPQYQDVIGKQEALSFLDIKLVNLMYKCSSKCENVQCPQQGFVGKDCKCWCLGSPVQPCGDSSTVQTKTKPVTTIFSPVSMCNNINENCQDWAEAGYCQLNSYVEMNCREACGICAKDMNPTSTVCKDEKPNCAELKKRGYCSGFYLNYMRTNCPFTCNLCGGLKRDDTASSSTDNLGSSLLLLAVISLHSSL